MPENRISVFGLKKIWVRVGSEEIQLEAAQEATFEAKQSLVDLMGDNSLVPLDSQPQSMEVTIKGRYGKVALSAVDALLGGTQVQNTGGGYTQPAEETGGCSMKNAITINSVNTSLFQSNTWYFAAQSATTYSVYDVQGNLVGTFSVAGYPRTDVVPGVTLVVNGTLEVGSWASFRTVQLAGGHTVESSSVSKNDFPAQVTVRAITEDIPGQGQLELIVYKAQPAGITVPMKTKDYALVDFEFRALFDTNVEKTFEIRKYTKPVAACV